MNNANAKRLTNVNIARKGENIVSIAAAIVTIPIPIRKALRYFGYLNWEATYFNNPISIINLSLHEDLKCNPLNSHVEQKKKISNYSSHGLRVCS